MDKMKIKKLSLIFTIGFVSFMLLTACSITNEFSKSVWDSKTKTYTDGTVKMTYIKTSVQDIEYDEDDTNQKIDHKTVNLDGKDRIAVRVYWKLENNSNKTISFKDLYAHAFSAIQPVSSVTQGGKKETLTRILAEAWPITEGYVKSHEDLKPGESVKTFDTYMLNDTKTPIEIYFNKYGEDESVGSYKISWYGKKPEITGDQLTVDAINNADKMEETNKKEDAAKKEKLTKTLEGIAADDTTKLTWTKADYDALVEDYSSLGVDHGKPTKLTDVLAKYPHPNYKDNDSGYIKLDYGDPGSDNFVSLSFKQGSGSASDFTLDSKSEKGLK